MDSERGRYVGSKISTAERFDIHLPDGGGRLEAVWIGPPPERAPTLIFLHEGLGCVALWRDFPARLAQAAGCGALVYSRLGYGRSDACPLPRPLDFMHHEGRMVLPGVIRRCGIRDYLLVGHSDGGSIALIHAGDASATGLCGVIILAAHVFCEELTRESIAETGKRYMHGGLRDRLVVYHGANTDGAFYGWHDVWLHPDFRHWTIEASLGRIAVPVLAVQGDDDPYGTAAQVEPIRRRCGRATVLMIAGGHAPHVENRDAVITEATRFIDRVTRGASPRMKKNR
jgi:pimeloyl-ACP methyl ester carboxylesterase